MSSLRKLRKIIQIGFVALALLSGAPVPPAKIEELLQQASQPIVVHQQRREKDEDEPPYPHTDPAKGQAPERPARR